MAKFKIAQDPTFKAKVAIPRVGGAVIEVDFQFKYRDRKELAELFTGWNARSKEDQERLKALGDAVTLVEVTEADIERQVDQVTELVAGWGFDDELSEESVRALVVTSAGAGAAIVEAYQQAFAPARLGN